MAASQGVGVHGETTIAYQRCRVGTNLLLQSHPIGTLFLFEIHMQELRPLLFVD
jgi:hypothetical protein